MHKLLEMNCFSHWTASVEEKWVTAIFMVYLLVMLFIAGRVPRKHSMHPRIFFWIRVIVFLSAIPLSANHTAGSTTVPVHRSISRIATIKAYYSCEKFRIQIQLVRIVLVNQMGCYVKMNHSGPRHVRFISAKWGKIFRSLVNFEWRTAEDVTRKT